jgi:hypothetical protein
MTIDKEIDVRLECLRIAHVRSSHKGAQEVIGEAEIFEKFVRGDSAAKTDTLHLPAKPR